MSLFRKRRSKADIQIIKTEPLKKKKDADDKLETEPVAEPDVTIDILGKQQLRDQFSPEEIQETAQQIAELALPEIVRQARQARQTWRIDEAFQMLQGHARRFGMNVEIEDELQRCLDDLAENAYFQRIANGQLAKILFDAAGFDIVDETPLQDPQDHLETRLTCACKDNDLRRVLETVASSPSRYYCYCLAEFERPLDMLTLGLIQDDFTRRKPMVNRRIHFAVCKESSPETNMVINVKYFADGFITIPLERGEMRRAVLTGTTASYLQAKAGAWTENHRLFATTLPVVRAGEFFGREYDLNQIMGAVNRGQSFYILGLRRMGKTSLVKHLENLGAFRSYLYAFLNLVGHLEQPNFDQATQDILAQWLGVLQRKHPKVAQRFSSRVSDKVSPYERLSAFLDQLRDVNYQEGLEIRCLAILDDVNLLLLDQNGAGSLWQRGARRLVRLFRHQQELVMTGLTLWDFETRDIIEGEHGGGLGQYTPIYLGPLSREECDRMITYIGGVISMQFEPESLQAIYAETGGHPLWTRLLCDAISRTRRSRSEQLTVNSRQVKQAAREFSSADSRFLDQLLEALPGAERRAVDALSRYSEPVQVAELPTPLSDKALAHLKHYGLVEEASDEPGYYSLRMRVLTRYLQA